MKLQILFTFGFVLLISSCAPVIEKSEQAPEYTRKYQHDTDGIGNNTGQIKVIPAIPKPEPKSKYGNPASYTVYGKQYSVLSTAKGYKQQGGASWYGKKFHGERTSSGETYNMYAMSAAHKTLPLPTYVKVTNLDNRQSVIVRVNDRGPFHDGRIIDLSYSAAKQLNIVGKGTGRVEVEAIDADNWSNKAPPEQIKKEPVKILASAFVSQTYIQVGAFSDTDNALSLARKLRFLFNYPVTISKKKSKNQWLSVVKVGPFTSQKLENIALKELNEQGYYMARIVK
ncbi:MAG: septal ring lytic transglycosylase RlpA family protein [Pseudomonadota bacterium]